MISTSRVFAVIIGAAALTALVTASVSIAYAHESSVAQIAVGPAVSAGRPILTPFRHPAPSGLKPYLGPSGTAQNNWRNLS